MNAHAIDSLTEPTTKYVVVAQQITPIQADDLVHVGEPNEVVRAPFHPVRSECGRVVAMLRSVVSRA